MRVGPSTRKRKNQKAYTRHIDTKINHCDFCDFTESSSQVIDSTSGFWIVKNIFAYDFWDDNPVIDHLMIIPKRHIEGLHEFTGDEAIEFFRLVQTYEQKGYALYARPPMSHAKSVPHQHTHLIKLDTKPSKFMLHIRKPHIVIHK